MDVYAFHQIIIKLDQIQRTQETIMASLDDLKNTLDQLGQAITTTATNVANLLTQIQANATDQTKVDALVAEAQAELKTLQAANASVPSS
jgi:septal ring factor EnvC (AmiA/AmiB activator)